MSFEELGEANRSAIAPGKDKKPRRCWVGRRPARSFGQVRQKTFRIARAHNFPVRSRRKGRRAAMLLHGCARSLGA